MRPPSGRASSFGSGDILVFRTGWRTKFVREQNAAEFMAGEPGLGLDCCQWIADHEIAVVASDNWAIEVLPGEVDTELLPVHMVLIRDMGVTLGEILDLDELAADCEADGVWEFFLDRPPDQVHRPRSARRSTRWPSSSRDIRGATHGLRHPCRHRRLLDELRRLHRARDAPLAGSDDNERFFDHRREDARTDWDRGGLPNDEWEALLHRAKRLADKAGHYRYHCRRSSAARTAPTWAWRSIREHLARKGLGLFNDLQNEHSIVGNNVGLLLMIAYGTDEQKAEWVDDLAEGRKGFAFGITEPQHGSDATHMETVAVRDGDEWVINGEKTWNTGIHKAQYDMIMARTSRRRRRRRRHHRVPGPDQRRPGSRSSSSCGRSTCPPIMRTSG